MSEPQVDITLLQKRDPAAWTALLNEKEGVEDIVVTAVSVKPVRSHFSRNGHGPGPTPEVHRYTLGLAGCSDPITFVGKRTSRNEALFYRDVASRFPFLAPRCYFAHVFGELGWILIDDVPNHFPPPVWKANDVEDLITDLTALHATFWNLDNDLESYDWLPRFIGRQQKTYSMSELRQEQAIFFEEGPAAVISEHAINSAGRLAPLLLQAANGLVVLRDLGGWPGILGESHLAAVADLLDDPVPMLEPLQNLPQTLLHGDPHSYHWRVTMFGENRLLDWREAVIGPGIWDLICFLEQFDLLVAADSDNGLAVRQERPATDETIVDSYMLAMSAELGRQFNARAFRLALPAARCLHVLTNWFPYFASWFSQMPDKFAWQKLNRVPEEQLEGTVWQPMAGFRAYMAGVFQRFLKSYRSL